MPRDTVDATQMPVEGWAATICLTAIRRNTADCTQGDDGAFAGGENGKSGHASRTVAEMAGVKQ